MRKLMIAAGIALTIFTATASTKAEAASSVLTKQEAAKKIAAAQIKAAEQKKNVTITYKIKATKKNYGHVSWETLWKGGQGNGVANGQCDEFAWTYKKLAMMAGVKHVALAHIKAQNHVDSAVRLEDGRIYLLTADDGDHSNWFTEERKEKDLANLIEHGFQPEGTVWTMDDYAKDCLRSSDEDLRNDIYKGEKYDFEWEDGKKESFSYKDCQSALYSKYAL